MGHRRRRQRRRARSGALRRRGGGYHRLLPAGRGVLVYRGRPRCARDRPAAGGGARPSCRRGRRHGAPVHRSGQPGALPPGDAHRPRRGVQDLPRRLPGALRGACGALGRRHLHRRVYIRHQARRRRLPPHRRRGHGLRPRHHRCAGAHCGAVAQERRPGGCAGAQDREAGQLRCGGHEVRHRRGPAAELRCLGRERRPGRPCEGVHVLLPQVAPPRRARRGAGARQLRPLRGLRGVRGQRR